MSEADNDNNISAYEKLRLANIARNEGFLVDIGISPSSKELRSTATATAMKKKSSGGKKRQSLPIEEVQPTRRSRRVMELPNVSYREASTINVYGERVTKDADEIFYDESDFGNMLIQSTSNLNGSFIGLEEEHSDVLPRDSVSKSEKMCMIPSSISEFARDIYCNYCTFLDKKKLCIPIEEYGKAAVMSMSNGGRMPRFSKYSGVVEWKNCVYLWVNLGGKTGYSNAFFDEGRSIIWFGGSRMTRESPVIQRLLQHKVEGPEGTQEGRKEVKDELASEDVGLSKSTGAPKSEDKKTPKIEIKKETTIKGDEDAGGGDMAKTESRESKEEVLLFVRIEGEGYSCLGRLRAAGCDLNTSPVKIQFLLADYAQFKDSLEFKRVLKEGGVVDYATVL